MMNAPINKLITGICLLFSILVGIDLIGLRINLTQSMPLGLYIAQKQTAKRGDIVAVCLPKSIAQEGISHKYLLHGVCPSLSMPLLKQLIAVPGDRVIVTRKTLCVNHTSYLAPVFIFDSHNQRIQRHINNSNFITWDYWIYGANDKLHSWDSRYFGGIKKNQIQAVFKPLLVFKGGDERKSPKLSSPESQPNKQIAHTYPALGAKSHSVLGKPKIPDPAHTTKVLSDRGQESSST